jgi:hypothetical protein
MNVEITLEDLNSGEGNLRLKNSNNHDQVFIDINNRESVLININQLRMALRKVALKD